MRPLFAELYETVQQQGMAPRTSLKRQLEALESPSNLVDIGLPDFVEKHFQGDGTTELASQAIAHLAVRTGVELKRIKLDMPDAGVVQQYGLGAYGRAFTIPALLHFLALDPPFSFRRQTLFAKTLPPKVVETQLWETPTRRLKPTVQPTESLVAAIDSVTIDDDPTPSALIPCGDVGSQRPDPLNTSLKPLRS